MKSFFRIVTATIFFLSVSHLHSQGTSALKFYDSGLAKQNAEDFYGASEDFQQAVQINPSYGDAWFHLAHVTYSLGDYSLALSYLESADKYAKNRSDILNLRGLCFISLGRLNEAKDVFESVIKKYPNDIDSRFGLAELDLFNGSFIGAEKQYEDALKRQANNRKALLSLALICEETGKTNLAEKYIEQALKFHSDDPEVHYLCAYLAAKNARFTDAERRIRAAVQLKSDYTKAYVLLCSILYAQKRYDEAIDICDYLIARNRNTSKAWFLKGLSQYRKNEINETISTWSSALAIDPQDEMMRSALELLVMKELPVEDERRADWAAYHVKKARDYSKTFKGEEARYEYQRALKLNPNDALVRSEFSEILNHTGLNENYLYQLKFIQNGKKSSDKMTDAEKAAENKINDTIEAYESLMKYSLSAKWDVDPFYLDKTRWHIGIFYTKSPVQLVHSDAEEITAGMACDIFSGVATTSVDVFNQPVSGYGQAYSLARKNNLDYFIMLSVDENEREVSLDAVVYSGRTGTQTTKFSSFRTGNDRFASVLRAFRRDVLDMLPIRGKIIERSVNEILIDLGSVEGIKDGAVLDVVKAGKIQTADKGLGVVFDEKNALGTITVTKTGEEISQGTLSQNGFYDRVNVGDEVLIKSLPKSKDGGDEILSETSPAAGENGSRILPEDKNRRKLNAQELGLVKTPGIIDLIRSIKG